MTRNVVVRATALVGLLCASLAQAQERKDFEIITLSPEASAPGTVEGKAGSVAPRSVRGRLIPNGTLPAPGRTFEVEPNGTPATATPLTGTSAIAVGNVFPGADLDFWSFSATAGDRVYAATMTSFSANASTDSQLTLIASDGATTIEFDDDDGSLGGLSSSIAGATIPTSGTYYLKVNHFTAATGQLRPYELRLRLQSGAPTAEVEPNDTPATATALPANGWMSGSRSSTTDADFYSLNLAAGDTVYLSLDLDPERDTTTWNGRLGFALFGDTSNQILVVDDAGTVDTIDSEAFFMTVKTAGTYFAFVDSAAAVAGSTYHLSVTVFPAVPEGTNCTTYASTNVPQTIGPGATLVSSTITVPGNPRIADLDVEIVLNHLAPNQIDAHLRSPAGNDNGIFTDIGSGGGGQTQMDTVLDDEAGLPPLYTVLKGPAYKPELAYRLSWFDGEDAGGTWTLDLRDDIADANGGTLTGWSLRICEPVPTTCAAGYAPVTVYTSDFEASDGGFTHSGTLDEWARGLPTAVAINTCNSGTNCWKTDLAGTYNASCSQDLLSPSIDLTGLSGPVVVNWSQRHQMENATFDHATVDLEQFGGGTTVRLFEWQDATMTDAVGNPPVTIQETAGWGRYSRRADSLAGLNTQLRFHLDSDTTVQLDGLAIDDVSVTACTDLGSYFTLTPCRLVDTRNAPGTYGGPALVAGADRTFPLFTQCGIPATAKAVSVNLTVANPTALGNLRLYPAGSPLPTVSSLNYSAGQTRGNNAIVPLSVLGEIVARCTQGGGTADFILDVNGYFK